MKISLNWLKKYVDVPDAVTPKDLGLKLTLATVEVEEVIAQAENLDKIVVGKILKIEKHPNADKLRLVEVDIKNEKLKVVCGGVNLTEGMLVALAKVGARVRWHGEGDLIELTPAKIRGVDSAGMICASEEIGLGEMFPAKLAGEIVDLTDLKLKVGQPLAEALKLNDVIIDIDNKSLTNRPDLWGHYGIAREVAAIFGTKLKDYKTEAIKEVKDSSLKVEIKDPDLCRRYLGVVIDNVKVGESPDWLKQNLQAIGLKSINNIVDVTNYLLFDLGQPMHAFDASLVYNKKIVVRRAKRHEKISTLDDVERELDENDLVIADEKKAVALAGIMGGANSQITDKTTSIVIESATFEPYTIRKTAQRLGLRTEASMRFEKSLDPELAAVAIEKAVELILQMCPEATVASSLVDEYPRPFPEITIETTYEFLNRRIGQDLGKDKINEILESLGFVLKKKNGELKVGVPSWRATKDVSIPEDLVEEVARLYGYDNLTPVMPQVSLSLIEQNKLRDLERECKNLLISGLGVTEVYNYSFTNKNVLEKFRLNPNDHIELLNYLSEDQNLLRQSLLPGLLQNVAENFRQVDKLNYFECGRVFMNKPGEDIIAPGVKGFLPEQPVILAGVYFADKDIKPFYAVKAMVENLLEKLNVKYLEAPQTEAPAYCHPHRAWQAEIGGEVFVTAGEIHPAVLAAFEVEPQVGFWQINLSKLNELYVKQYLYKPLAKFPAIKLDLAIIVDEKVLWKDVKNLVKNSAPQIITDIDLFDIYKNDKMGVGKQSLAFRVTYQASDRTLELKEVQKIQEKIMAQLKKAVKAEIRK